MVTPREPDRYEEKAEALLFDMGLNVEMVQFEGDRDRIAAALRQATDEALERAAREILIAFDNACWDGLADRVRTGKWTREASHV